MKRVIFLIGSMTVATAGFCGVGQYSDATICYVYKQDTLQKKLTCRYDVVEGAAMSYSFRQVSYTLPGFGKMATSNQANYNDRNEITGWTTTVNDEPAIIRYRLPTNQHIVSDAYAQSGKTTMECYLSTKSQWEICAE